MTPRRLAVKALIHQEQAGYANLVLDAELKKCDPPMNTRDAAFAARIFYTTLERLPLLDYTIDRYTKKPVAKLDAPVRAVLRSGLAQAKYMQVPMSAAVNESVRLTKALGKSSAAGMVNAVLRKAVVTEVHEDDFSNPLQRLGTYYCLSPAVAKLLYNQYGEEAFAMAGVFYERPATAIRVNTLRTTDEELTDLLHTEGHSVRPGPWPHALLVEFNGSPAASRAFARGLLCRARRQKPDTGRVHAESRKTNQRRVCGIPRAAAAQSLCPLRSHLCRSRAERRCPAPQRLGQIRPHPVRCAVFGFGRHSQKAGHSL